MKIPHLLASFAVAATASAADFKDPTEVARTWDESTVQSRPFTGDLSLRRAAEMPSSRVFSPPASREQPFRPAPLIDAPRNRAPQELPNNVPMPRGAKPWLYGGQTYWVLPLIPSREK